MTGWTEERIGQLSKLWAEGLSASQIAKKMGFITRNSVISKVHRLGLSGRKAPSSPASVQTLKAGRAARVALPQATRLHPAGTRVYIVAVNRPLPVEKPGGLTATRDLMDLGPHMCRWPIGDPQRADFGFCGRNAGDTYCGVHAKRAYASPTLQTYVDSRLVAPTKEQMRA